MNIYDKLSEIKEYFSPKIVAEVNDQFMKIAKIKGDDLPWHSHANEDELFLILEGQLCMEIENETPRYLKKGDVFVVKKGIVHKVSAEEECSILLFESKSTQHTGDVESPISKSIHEQKF